MVTLISSQQFIKQSSLKTKTINFGITEFVFCRHLSHQSAEYEHVLYLKTGEPAKSLKVINIQEFV